MFGNTQKFQTLQGRGVHFFQSIRFDYIQLCKIEYTIINEVVKKIRFKERDSILSIYVKTALTAFLCIANTPTSIQSRFLIDCGAETTNINAKHWRHLSNVNTMSKTSLRNNGSFFIEIEQQDNQTSIEVAVENLRIEVAVENRYLFNRRHLQSRHYTGQSIGNHLEPLGQGQKTAVNLLQIPLQCKIIDSAAEQPLQDRLVPTTSLATKMKLTRTENWHKKYVDPIYQSTC